MGSAVNGLPRRKSGWVLVHALALSDGYVELVTSFLLGIQVAGLLIELAKCWLATHFAGGPPLASHVWEVGSVWQLIPL